MDKIKITAVVTGTGEFANGKLKTGLWLSELTHIYHSAKEKGYEITVASPEGGNTPVDPVSLKAVFLDETSRRCWNDPQFRQALQHTPSLQEVAAQPADCIYLAGGHGAMYDFPRNPVLQSLILQQYESGKMVAAICHGLCGLLNVKLPDGEYLIKGKKLTGFSWLGEMLAGRKNDVPYNLEATLKQRGADYRKALLPVFPEVVVDENLVTGQNPFSSKALARVVLCRLERKKK